MSHFECPLNRRFCRSKKVVQVVQIGGGGEVIWTKSKRTAAAGQKGKGEKGQKGKRTKPLTNIFPLLNVPFIYSNANIFVQLWTGPGL